MMDSRLLIGLRGCHVSIVDKPLMVVRADRELQSPRIDAEIRARGVDLVLTPSDMSESAFIDVCRRADLILTCYQPVTAAVVDSAPDLRAVVKYGVGIDAIDLEATRRRGIPVVNVPDYAQETVAEAAFMLMIALAKNLRRIQSAMRTHGWLWPEPTWLGADVFGKTVGLVGTGHIGRSMARMCGQGFGARVLGYDPHVSAESMRSAGVEKREGLREMLAECDFASIHATLSATTHHLIGGPDLAAMKPSAYLINVSRGELVDEAAVVQTLREGSIAGAGLDTYGIEPLALTGQTADGPFGGSTTDLANTRSGVR